MTHPYLQIETGVGSSKQESTFMNATLSGLASGLAISIAVTPPDHLQDMSEEELVAALREELLPLAQIGYLIEVQIGPDDDCSNDEDDEDYDDQGNLRAGCGHNEAG
jgi:hypothetical protein